MANDRPKRGQGKHLKINGHKVELVLEGNGQDACLKVDSLYLITIQFDPDKKANHAKVYRHSSACWPNGPLESDKDGRVVIRDSY